MPETHERPSGMLAEEPGANAAPGECFDPLSDVLRTVKLQGAQFFLTDATSPWCVEVPAAEEFAGIILPNTRHIVSYHIVLEGRGLAGVPGLDPVALEAGDVIVFPHGDAYWMSSAAGISPEVDREQTLQFFRDLAAGKLPFVISEGGGRQPKAQFICGFLGCDLAPFNPLFATLPRIVHIRRPSGDPADLLDQLIDLTIAEARARRVGAESIRVGLVN